MAATIGVAIIYIASTNIIAGIVPNTELVTSNAPFGLTFSLMFNSTVGKFVTSLDSFLRGFHAWLAVHDRQSVPAIRRRRFLPEMLCES